MTVRFNRGSMRICCAFAATLAITTFPRVITSDAKAQTQLQRIIIEGATQDDRNRPLNEQGVTKPLTSTTVGSREISAKAPHVSDTASLLRDIPGVAVYSGGGVSGLPVIQGMADDRVKVLVNGALISSACANHMNPPLSYADPKQIKMIDVFAGVTPVSQGGDSTGGTILVEKLPSVFAAPGEEVTAHGSLTSFWRSNGNVLGVGATASVATGNVAIGYTGNWTRSDNYEDGAGREVLSSEYEAQNHALTLAARKHGDLFVLEAGLQHIPYQGYVNQWMDMTLNRSWYVNGRYEGKFDWGKLDIRAYYRDITHEMNFLDDKLKAFSGEMPMNVDGVDTGYSIKAEIPLSAQDIFRIGNEFHHQGMDDYWPPVESMMGMMCCETFVNINNGTRDRLGTFVEWERKWSPRWMTLLGARNDIVWMDAGNVQGYNSGMMYGADAAAFNAEDHAKTDVNFDLTALARYQPDAMHSFEAGYARKTRSPNLYERYAWSTSAMASSMVTWFGDLNGYVGNLDLEPEVAHKVSFTAAWHDPTRKEWELKVTPYYSYVEDFITAEVIAAGTVKDGFNQLQFVNHDAELYGVDISGRLHVGEFDGIGHFALIGVVSYVHGDDLETDNPLYHMMPWNARLALHHRLGAWTNVAELELVGEQTRVDETRLEPITPAYALINLRSSYQWENVRLDVGVENLFDKLYFPPLGGAYWETGAPGDPVAGMGRSFYAGMTIRF